MAKGSKHSIRFDGRPKIVLSGSRPLQHFRIWQRCAEIDLKSLQAIDVDNGAFASTINGICFEWDDATPGAPNVEIVDYH